MKPRILIIFNNKAITYYQVGYGRGLTLLGSNRFCKFHNKRVYSPMSLRSQKDLKNKFYLSKLT